MADVTKAESILAQIEKAAPAIGADYDAHQASIQAERDAEATVLERAIAAAKPALKALSGAIRQSEREFWPDNVSTDTETTSFKERGFPLLGEGPKRDYPRANDGALKGWRLYLLSDGRLAEVKYTGSWTRWQGRSSGWEAEMRILTPREAMDEYDLEKTLAALAEQLGAQANREDATKAAQARADRLSAIVKLVR